MATYTYTIADRMKAPIDGEYITLNKVDSLNDCIQQLRVYRELNALNVVWAVIDKDNYTMFVSFDGSNVYMDRLVIETMRHNDKRTTEIKESITNITRHSNAKKRKNKGILELVQMANSNAKISVTVTESDIIEMLTKYEMSVSVLKRQLVKVVNNWAMIKAMQK